MIGATAAFRRVAGGFFFIFGRSPFRSQRACVWTLGGVLSDEQFERLLKESETALRPFVIDGGTIEFDMPRRSS
jgi:hypothetical protein